MVKGRSEIRALKGPNIPAQGIALGDSSIPQIPFIKFHFVTQQKSAQFLLKRHAPMVFFLRFNVTPHAFNAGLTH